MNFGPGMRLPNNNFGNSVNNRGFNNNQSRFNFNINNSSLNKVKNVQEPQRTYKSVDGTKWASYDQAVAHNRKIYSGETIFKSNKFK